MTRLIIYINSEQKASAYRVEENNSSSISFYGNDYESDFSQFCKIVMEELRVNSLNEIEKKGGISVLIVSNGAANEKIRELIWNFLHDENEEGVLNVNIQELNVIEAKYILPLIGNPAEPCAEDFKKLFSLENSSFVKQNDFDDLKASNLKLMDEISEYKNKYDKMLNDNSEKDLIIKKTESLLSEFMQFGGLCKIDFKNDLRMSDIEMTLNQNVVINILKKEGSIVTKNTIIASYQIIKVPTYQKKNGIKKITDAAMAGAHLGGVIGVAVGVGVGVANYHDKRNEYQIVNIYAKETGKIFYTKNNNETVQNGDIIAIIGKETWSREDADFFLKKATKTS